MADEYTYNPPWMPGATAMLTRSDGAFIPCELDNRDYQQFLTWLEAGNTAPEGWTGPTNPQGASP